MDNKDKNLIGKKYIDTDEIWNKIGQFGKFQWIFYFVICLQSITFATHNLASVYLAADQKFHCISPYNSANLTGEDHCFLKNNSRETEEFCDAWFFAEDFRTSSITSEWNIVCDQKWLRSVIQAVYMGGLVVGSFFMGDLADRFGRVPVIFGSSLLLFSSSIATVVCPEIVSFSVVRFLSGVSLAGVHNTAYVWILEMVGTDYRAMAALGSELFWSLGFLLLAASGFLFRDWVRLQLAIGVPTVCFILYRWILPESPRWLITQSRFDEADHVFRKAARINGTVLPEELNLRTVEKSGHSLLDLLRTPNLRKRTLVLWFCWFVVSLVFYALSLNASSLAGDPYLNFAFMGFVEIPGFLFCLMTLWKIKRRTILCSSFAATGIVLLMRLVIPFIPIDPEYAEVLRSLDTTCAMLGKMTASASFATMYVYTTEAYPTVIRSLGLGGTSMLARLGGMLAPFMAQMMQEQPNIPPALFGSCSLLASMLLILLPETRGRPLPESIEEGENFGLDDGKTKEQGEDQYRDI